MSAARVLVLAGTAEARELATRLAGIDAVAATASLAGVTRDPAGYAVPVRRGGFGGVAGLCDWLTGHRVAALIDATHPFATAMQANAAAAAAAAGIPHLRLLRPAWPARPGWVQVPDMAAAAAALPAGARALLTAGRRDLAPFAGRTDLALILRTIEPVRDLPPHIRPLLARPGAGEAAERALMAREDITHLVARNSGGPATARLDAADALRLTTVIVDRPPRPPGRIAATVDEAVAWLLPQVATGPRARAPDASA